MPRKIRTTLLLVFTFIVLLVTVSIYQSPKLFSRYEFRQSSSAPTLKNRSNNLHLNYATREDYHQYRRNRSSLHVSSIQEPPPDSILVPDWEVLIVYRSGNQFPDSSNDGRYTCVFQNNRTSPAKYTGILPFSHLTTIKCLMPNSVRRLRPFLRPILTTSAIQKWPRNELSENKEMFRWSFLTYESLSTDNNVILFVKGVNNRQGINRSPAELRCLFGNNVRTAVTSSSQEVFRCLHPNTVQLRRLFLTGNKKIKVSIEVGDEKPMMVPSVAYYTPQALLSARSSEKMKSPSQLCACTMVYNVAKFLREWVTYHSKIGIEKFILYDNGSDDDLQRVVEELVEEEFDVKTLFWPWSKTQEAGFSHCAMYAKDSCAWMMYMDVDEFFFSPSWRNSSYPSKNMLKSFLPKKPIIMPSSSLMGLSGPIGQISVRCFEYGPSNQGSHPIEGVTQGYTCRRREEQRHKSIVLLEAIDTSLVNVIHHFELKQGYRTKRLSPEEGLVNHYKYQAWPEFKAKFRRRVSAYVVDWREELNPKSKDRTPGLGFAAIEPKGWANKFCEVNDNRLKFVTRKWFSTNSSTGYKMVWQS